MEPEDSLRMRDEHLDTIPKMESNEFINYSVENLVPNPSESEDLSDSECDVPACDNFTTFSNLLFDADDDFSSSDNETFFDEDIDSFLDEFTDELILLKSIPSRIDEVDCDTEEEILEDSDSSMKEIYLSFTLDDSMPPDDDSEILTIKLVSDISEHDVPMPRLLPTQPTLVLNQEKSPHLLSHRGLKAFQLPSESPMMIYGGNTPILDVPFLYFYAL
nr:hypothetical protein [Tanacetum cinerariifolium]